MLFLSEWVWQICSIKGLFNIQYSSDSLQVCWLPVCLNSTSIYCKDGKCFLSEHNGLQQPPSYVNKSGTGMPPKSRRATLLVSKKIKKPWFSWLTKQRINMYWETQQYPINEYNKVKFNNQQTKLEPCDRMATCLVYCVLSSSVCSVASGPHYPEQERLV